MCPLSRLGIVLALPESDVVAQAGECLLLVPAC